MSAYTSSMLIACGKLFIWFWLLFAFLPRQIFPPPIKGEKRIWFDIVRMSFYTILIVYVLAYFRIYDVFSLMGGYVLLYLFLLFIRPPIGLPLTDMERFLSRMTAHGIDILEKNVNYGDMIQRHKERINAWGRSQLDRKDNMLWALAIALPAAYFASTLYLNFFADRIDSPILVLIVSGALAVTLAWTTVAGHAIRIARANPIVALRYE